MNYLIKVLAHGETRYLTIYAGNGRTAEAIANEMASMMGGFVEAVLAINP